MKDAIAQHAPNRSIEGTTVRLALELLDLADNVTGVTRVVTHAELARRLRVSTDTIGRATAILRAAGVCWATHVYRRRRRVGMRYTLTALATGKPAPDRQQEIQDLRTRHTSSAAPPGASPPRPSDGQIRLALYAELTAQPAISDDALVAAAAPIVMARYGLREPHAQLRRQLPIVRRRHDPHWRRGGACPPAAPRPLALDAAYGCTVARWLALKRLPDPPA